MFYRHAYYLVLHKHGELLYNGVVATIRHHLDKMVTNITQHTDDQLLSALRNSWDTHRREMTMIRDVLMYMDRTYVPGSHKLLIYDQGTLLFRDVVVYDSSIQSRTTRLLLQAIDDNRRNKPMDVPLIRSILSMYMDLGIGSSTVYIDNFETKFLQDTVQYYTEESNNYLSNNNTGNDYLKMVELRLAQERERGLNFLHSSTLPRLAGILERTLIADHAVYLLELENNGFISLLEKNYKDDILRMYRLFALVKTTVSWSPNNSTVSASSSSSSSSSSISSSSNQTSGLSSASSISSVPSGTGSTGGTLNSPMVPSSSTLSVPVVRQITPLAIMREMMRQHILMLGRTILYDEEINKSPTHFIDSIIQLRNKYADIIDYAFDSDKEFQRALKEAFESFLNIPNDHRPAEYLSSFIDDQMKVQFKDKPEDIIHTILNSVIVIFRVLHNKDEFEEWYKLHLQKRLLSRTSISEDIEKIMISKLKTECGFQFTSKLEGMFNDLRVSNDFMIRYKQNKRSLSNNSNPSSANFPIIVPKEYTPQQCNAIDLDVTILTMVNWPPARYRTCALPNELIPVAEQFRQTYLSAHTGRKLLWHTEKGTADILFHVNAPSSSSSSSATTSSSATSLSTSSPSGTEIKKHELIVSTWHMIMLVLFNQNENIAFRTICEALPDIPRNEIVRHLLSVSHPKLRILQRNSKNKEIEDTDIFSINDKFESKLYRIKVPLISLKSSIINSATKNSPGISSGSNSNIPERTNTNGSTAADEEGGDIMVQVETQRKNMIDASIVRIMKSRKSMDHSNLVAEVIHQLTNRFLPTLIDIKKRIENLIEREYIERDKDDKRMYNYLA